MTFTQQVTSAARYFTITESRRRSAGITADTPSNLRDPSNSVDNVVITHRDFYDSALRLASHRATQGLSASLVEVQDVQNEFSYGLLDLQAIGDFLTYSYEYWKPRPSYVLLVGDGNHDPRDNMGCGEPNYIPPLSGMR